MRANVERARSSSVLAPVSPRTSGATGRAPAELRAKSLAKSSSSSSRSASANAAPAVTDSPAAVATAASASSRYERAIAVLLGDAASRERDDLAGVVQPALVDRALDEMPVGREHDPAADLQRDGQRLAQPRLRLLGPAVVEREDRQAADDVLHLEVACRPCARTTSAPGDRGARPRRDAAEVGDDPEPGGGLRLDPMAAEVLGELEAASELRLRRRESWP